MTWRSAACDLDYPRFILHRGLESASLELVFSLEILRSITIDDHRVIGA
jgi:hypothetical protein